MNSNRKRGANWITAKKCLRHFEDCGILNIKKDICVNRCPTGATDRRLARLNDYDKNSRLTLAEQGGYFCVLLLSLPIEYPIPKQVKPKLNTAISPKISIGSALLSPDSLAGFYVIGGSQSLRRGLTAYHLGCENLYQDRFFFIFQHFNAIHTFFYFVCKKIDSSPSLIFLFLHNIP